MKQIKYFSLPIIVLLLSLSHQSCIEDLEMPLNGHDTYVIDATLNSSDSIHFVQIGLASETPIDSLTKFSVKLTDDNGEVRIFKDTKELFDNLSLLNDSQQTYCYRYEDILDRILGARLDSILGPGYLLPDGNTILSPREIVIKNYTSRKSKIFFSSDCKLEIGKKYTLTITIDDKEYSATEKLLPPIEVKSMKYKKIQAIKGIEKIPIFNLINQSKESKYFIASFYTPLNSLTKGCSIRLFSTENMRDTINELQFSKFYYEPSYNGGDETPLYNNDAWYVDDDDRSAYRYCFYSISKANYDYYKTIVKQIKTDGGIYSPNAATPVTNFTGGKIYGQFIVTSESHIDDNAGY